jgi:ADP-heptose:LPS heptosyltransferase
LSATLVYLSGALGDVLLSTPALAALRAVTVGRVQLVAPRALAQLFPQLADEFINIDSARAAALFGPDAADMLQAAGSTTAIVFEPPASALPRNLRRVPRLMVHAIDATPRHCVCHHYSRFVYERLCAALGCTPPFAIPQPHACAPAAPPVAPFAVVHPGSGAPRKSAPARILADACRELQDDHAWSWQLIAGEADTAAARRFCQDATLPVTVVAAPPLPELAWYLQHAQAYVGNDAGVSHLAGIAGARGVVFFGPTDPQIWRPLGSSLVVRRFEQEF